jgi:hypothetical protein
MKLAVAKSADTIDAKAPKAVNTSIGTTTFLSNAWSTWADGVPDGK